MYLNNLAFLVVKNQQLQETINRKDEEMRAMEERYRKYLEKAKNVSFSHSFHFLLIHIHIKKLCYVALCCEEQFTTYLFFFSIVSSL